jgi:hypothetical protein
MMSKALWFDWKKINTQCSGSIACIYKKFEQGDLPPGSSFLLNLDGVLNHRVSINHKVMYFYLASLRNYFDYEYRDNLGLYLYFSDIKIEHIKQNKLLTIENDYIRFYYEESKNGHQF